MIMETVQTLDLLGHWGDMRDNSAEVLSQFFFLQEAIVRSSGMSP